MPKIIEKKYLFAVEDRRTFCSKGCFGKWTFRGKEVLYGRTFCGEEYFGY
jgi:hypothetical protein